MLRLIVGTSIPLPPLCACLAGPNEGMGHPGICPGASNYKVG